MSKTTFIPVAHRKKSPMAFRKFGRNQPH